MSSPFALWRSIPARLLLALIWIYRHSLSAIMGTQCRFTPTCSVYTAESIRRFGAWRGSLLGAARIARCHPWGRPGPDPVPEVFPAKFFSKKSCSCDRTLPDSIDHKKERRSA